MCLPSAEIDALLRNRPTEAVGTLPLTPALLHQNLERDNSRGYVFAEQEFGLCVVAAPIFDSSDKTVAAVSVGWLGKPTSSASARRPYVEAVIAAAEEITTALKQVDNGPVE
jgi:DNA-binding IclR family transcriptional regulator